MDLIQTWAGADPVGLEIQPFEEALRLSYTGLCPQTYTLDPKFSCSDPRCRFCLGRYAPLSSPCRVFRTSGLDHQRPLPNGPGPEHGQAHPPPPRTLILQKVFIASFCNIQFPHKSVNLFLILVVIKDNLTDLCGS